MCSYDLENARKLTEAEFTYNAQLGFISLNLPLNNDEVLAVSYEYTYKGETYKVGELSTDGSSGQEALILKLLKPTIINPKRKIWDLMMKNVYSIGAYQVGQEGFRMNILYNNPQTSVLIPYFPFEGVKDEQLVQLLEMDRINYNYQPFADGVGLLFLPKVLIAIKAGFDGRVVGFGGILRAAASTLAEVALSTLTAPIFLMFQTRSVSQVLRGADGGWPAQSRGDGSLSFGDAWSASYWIVLTGAAVIGAAQMLSPALVPWLLPVALPMVISPVLIAWLSRPGFPTLFTTPTEIAAAPIMVLQADVLSRWSPSADTEADASAVIGPTEKIAESSSSVKFNSLGSVIGELPASAAEATARGPCALASCKMKSALGTRTLNESNC